MEPTRPSRIRRPVPRRAGRPGGDGPDLRARLLDVATDLFSRKGIAATSLRDIAKAAGVTPALLHYYFGDKAQLQQAMISERLMPAFAAMRAPLLGAGDDIAALVATFIRGIADVIAAHPWLPPLWVREVLCDGGALREVLLGPTGPRLAQLLADRFAAAQARGEINRDLDPRLLVVSLIGLTMFPAAGAPIWRSVFHADDIDDDTMRDHTIALLDRGLELPHAK